MNKPRLSILSLDIIIKLKTMLTTSQILNLTALSAQTSWMFSSCHAMTSSLGTRTWTQTNLRVFILTIL